MIGWPFSFSVANDQTTSCAVSGVPSWNFASGTQRESVGQPIIGDTRTLRAAKSVHGIGFVARTDHERRKRKLHALRSVALENEAIERIEGLERLVELAVRPNLREHAAFRALLD